MEKDAYDLTTEYVRLLAERRRLQREIDDRNSRLHDLAGDLTRIALAAGPLLGDQAYGVTHGHRTFAVRRGPNANRLDCAELTPAGSLIGVKPDAPPIAADAVADSPSDDDPNAALVSFARWRDQ